MLIPIFCFSAHSIANAFNLAVKTYSRPHGPPEIIDDYSINTNVDHNHHNATMPPRKQQPQQPTTPGPPTAEPLEYHSGEADRSLRALSPAEQLADAARATSPARFYVRAKSTTGGGATSPRLGGGNTSGFQSFSGLLGSEEGGEATTLSNESYGREDSYVAAQLKKRRDQSQAASPAPSVASASGSRRRSTAPGAASAKRTGGGADRAFDPRRDIDHSSSSADDDAGEGVASRWDPRVNRGRMPERGEGYLGMGLWGGSSERRRRSRGGGNGGDETPKKGGGSPGKRRTKAAAAVVDDEEEEATAVEDNGVKAGQKVQPPHSDDVESPAARSTAAAAVASGLLDLPLALVNEFITKPARRLVRFARHGGGGNALVILGVVGLALAWLSFLRGREPAIAGGDDRGVGETPVAYNAHGWSRPYDPERIVQRLEAIERAPPKIGGGESVDVTAIRQQIASLGGDLRRHERATAQQLDAVNDRLNSLETTIAKAMSEDVWMERLARALPRHVPVRSTPQGLVIDPAFYTELKRVTRTSWHDFEAENGEDLRRWAEAAFDRRVAYHELVPKEQFLGILEQELRAQRASLEVERRKELQAEIKAIKSGQPLMSAPPDLAATVNALIDRALIRYSKDTIAKQDYALATAGARVHPGQTSPTMILRKPWVISQILWGSRSTTGRTPDLALHPNTQPGMCWPFEGQEGSLGVILSRKVRITDVTIEHIAKEMTPEIGTAPKEVEVWVLPDDPSLRERFPSDDSTYPSHVLAASFVYDPDALSPLQSFPIHADLQELELVTENVIFRFKSNHGGDYTCVYRVSTEQRNLIYLVLILFLLRRFASMATCIPHSESSDHDA